LTGGAGGVSGAGGSAGVGAAAEAIPALSADRSAAVSVLRESSSFWISARAFSSFAEVWGAPPSGCRGGGTAGEGSGGKSRGGTDNGGVVGSWESVTGGGVGAVGAVEPPSLAMVSSASFMRRCVAF